MLGTLCLLHDRRDRQVSDLTENLGQGFAVRRVEVHAISSFGGANHVGLVRLVAERHRMQLDPQRRRVLGG